MHSVVAPLLAALAATQPPQAGSVLLPQPATLAGSLVVRMYSSKVKAVATRMGETLTAYHASSSQCPKLSKSDLALQKPLYENATRKPFLWTHIHKCAGSSMCALANLNNENMTKAQSTMNCNTCGDTCRISVAETMACEASWAARNCAYSASLSCTARQNRATRSSFMGQERFVDVELCPAEELNYGIMLREPLERLISNTQYARDMEGYGAWDVSPEQVLSLIQPNASSCLDGPCDDCMNCDTVERSPAAYDNLYVRTLAGYDPFTLPAGQLTRAHLQAAKARLSAYSVVLILDEYENHEPQLSHWLGWTVTSLASERVTETKERSSFFTDEQLDTLARANELDYELYCFAKSLAAARTAEVSGIRRLP